MKRKEEMTKERRKHMQYGHDINNYFMARMHHVNVQCEMECTTVRLPASRGGSNMI
jgi:hypothetical protein